LRDGWRITTAGTLDMRPLLSVLADSSLAERARSAALLHDTLAAALLAWVEETARRSGIATVVAAGGCLLNRRLAESLRAGLSARGLHFVEACNLPPNDGGLSLGQAWVALRRIRSDQP